MAASVISVQDGASQPGIIAEDPVTQVTSAFLSSYISREHRASIIKPATVPGDDEGLPDGATSTLSALLRSANGEAQTPTEILNGSPKDAAEGEPHVAAQPALTPDALALAQKIASMLRPGPPFFSEMDNAALVGYIGNAQVMNGDQAAAATQSHILTASDAASQQSVWAALDSLPIGAGWAQIPNSLATQSPSDAEGPFSVAAWSAYDGDDGLWSALMLTCDLPTLKSVAAASESQDTAAEVDISGLNVQLGHSVVIPTNILKKTRFYLGNQKALGRSILVGQRPSDGDIPFYPWDDFSSSTPPLRASTAELFDIVALWTWPSWVPFLGKPKPSSPPSIKPEPPVGKKRVWVPSRTKVSIYATWWGYRLYLPPPVMKSLTEDLGTAESIAKVLSTVLSFIITHIPTSAIPPQLIPLVTVLQAIAPLTGYLATFIAWAWSSISSMDKGDGIVLSATWILPVAIIPKAWDAPIIPADGSNGTMPPPSQGPPPTAPVAPAPAPAPAQPLPSGSSPAPLPIGMPSAQGS